MGGSSTINGSAFIAPSRAGINAWAKLGNPRWTYDALLPYYKKAYSIQPPDSTVCKSLGIDEVSQTNESTSADGPIRVSFPSLAKANPLAKAWNEVFRSMGYNTTADRFPSQGTGNRCYTAAIDPQTKKRMSAHSQYGDLASKRPSFHSIAGATVLKILFSGSGPANFRAYGVEVSIDGEVHSISAHREVVLAAGALHTPKLLELAGIGESSRLRTLDILPVIDSAGVGENLQNHAMCIRIFGLNKDVEVGEGIQSLAFLPLRERVQREETRNDAPPKTPNQKDFDGVVHNIFDSPAEASCCVFSTFVGLPDYASLGLM